MPVAQLPDAFPSLKSAGPRVNAKSLVEPGTSLWTLIGYIGAICVGLGLAVATMGVILIPLVIAYLVDLFLSARVMAQLRGSTVEVGPAQLAQIHRCVEEMSERLGIDPPQVFVAEASSINAFAARIGRRSVVILYDDVISGALRSGNPDALSFIVAHELAHHALGHTGRLRGYLRTINKKLARLDEQSSDNVAIKLVGDRAAAVEGLTLLLVGPEMLPYIDRKALAEQAQEVVGNAQSRKAEKTMSYPLLLRRLSRALAG